MQAQRLGAGLSVWVPKAASSPVRLGLFNGLPSWSDLSPRLGLLLCVGGTCHQPVPAGVLSPPGCVMPAADGWPPLLEQLCSCCPWQCNSQLILPRSFPALLLQQPCWRLPGCSRFPRVPEKSERSRCWCGFCCVSEVPQAARQSLLEAVSISCGFSS